MIHVTLNRILYVRFHLWISVIFAENDQNLYNAAIALDILFF
jgi:hypothetical protein